MSTSEANKKSLTSDTISRIKYEQRRDRIVITRKEIENRFFVFKMKIINDTLSINTGFHLPLLKLINEYAWQTYLVHDLKMVLHSIVEFTDFVESVCDMMTPRLLNAIIQATLSNRKSMLFRRIAYDGHMLLLRHMIVKKWDLKWSSTLQCYQNIEKKIVYKYTTTQDDAELWLEKHYNDMKQWKMLWAINEHNFPEIAVDLDLRILRQCRLRIRVS
jgi:hypothetical protein